MTRAFELHLADPTARRWNFGAIYFLQGWIPGFALTSLFNFLIAKGLTAGWLGGLYAVIELPWAVEFLCGPVVDRVPFFRMGRYRFFIALSSIFAVGSLGLLLSVRAPDRHIVFVGAVFLAYSIFAALLDTATEAQIKEWTPEDERGKMCALTRGAYILAVAFSASFFSFTLERWGFQTSVLILMATSSVSLVPIVFIRERLSQPLFSLRFNSVEAQLEKRVDPQATRRFFRILGEILRRPETLFFLGFCFIFQFLLSACGLNLGVQIIQSLGWDQTHLSNLQSILQFMSGTIGVGFIGWWSDRAGHSRTLTALVLFSGLFFLTFSSLTAESARAMCFPIVFIVVVLLPDLMDVVLNPVLMTMSRRATAATQLAAFTAMTNLGDIAGSASSEFVQTHLSLSVYYMTAGFVIGAFGFALLTLGMVGSAQLSTELSPELAVSTRPTV